MLDVTGDILLKIREGSRCQICGVLMSTSRDHSDGVCGAHIDPEEQWLCTFALRMQAQFREFCEHQKRGALSRMPWISNAEQQRIDNYYLFRDQCEISQTIQAPDLLREQLTPNNPILEIEEINVLVPSPISYRHSAFKITLHSGDVYIYDPTGPQFGADWPLLERWTQYRLRIVGVPDIRPLGTRRKDLRL